MKYRYLFSVFLFVLISLSWLANFVKDNDFKREYNQYVNKMNENIEKGITSEVEINYNLAEEMKHSISLSKAYIDYQIKYKNEKLIKEQFSKYLNKFPKEDWIYVKEIKWGLENEDVKYAFTANSKALENKVSSPELKKLYDEFEYSFKLTPSSVLDVQDFESDDYAVVKQNEDYAFVNSKGSVVFSGDYQNAGAFNDELAPVVVAGSAPYFIDSKNQKKLVAENMPYTSLGLISNELFPAFNSSTNSWEFLKSNFEQAFSSKGSAILTAEEPTSLIGGIAGIRKETINAKPNSDSEEPTNSLKTESEENGSAKEIIKTVWRIVAAETGNEICSQKFKDVILSSKDVELQNSYLTKSGLFFAKPLDSDKFLLFDKKCERVGKLEFEDASVFKDETFAAVKINNLWGFINSSGEVKIEPKYQEAKSFSNNFAAVKINNLWGFINSSGKSIIEPKFLEVRNFSSKGLVFVKSEVKKNSSKANWQTLQLIKYEMEKNG